MDTKAKQSQEHVHDAAGYDVVGAIMDFEQGELDDDDTITLFQHLVDTGMAWQLQGFYGRTAMDMIERGVLHVKNLH